MRSLVLLGILIAIIYGAIGIGVAMKAPNASWTPKLALDLEGGTQIVLKPQLDGGKAPTQDEINQAIAVMRQRVDASGVAEAEITSQGGGNIVVALPGHPSQETLDLVRTSAIMNFRPVLQALIPGKVTPQTEAATPEPSGEATGEPTPEATATPEPGASVEPAPTGKDQNNAENSAYTKPKAAASPSAGATPEPTAAPEPTASPEPTPAAEDPTVTDYKQDAPETKPTDKTSQDWITDSLMAKAYELDCTDPKNRTGGPTDSQNTDVAIVSCSQDGQIKYILGPVAVEGANITNANSGLKPLGQTVSNEWVVNLQFNSKGSTEFAAITKQLATYATGTDTTTNTSTQSQFAIVLDSLVISAPGVTKEIPGGSAFIEGNFTQESASQLANQLQFGALPISFTTQSEDQISATLGDEQLQHGLLAGLIGLILVAIYSLFQYRALGFVTIFSLIIAAIMAYGVITLLGWVQGYRLSLPGVCGLIVAIGITADSFIVYFERIKDQVRDGREYGQAVEFGWQRARRTILASDTVNFLAAIVLYLLAVGGVRGFAFTLGLTTILDLVIVFLFTHPVVTLLGKTKFFTDGHKLSGVSPERLGAPESVRYKGRGRFSGSTTSDGDGLSIAERKAGRTLASKTAAPEAVADVDGAASSGKDEI